MAPQLMGLAGSQGDIGQFAELVRANLRLQALRVGHPVSTAAAAVRFCRFMRRVLLEGQFAAQIVAGRERWLWSEQRRMRRGSCDSTAGGRVLGRIRLQRVG